MAVVENGASNNQVESNGVDHSGSSVMVSRSNDNDHQEKKINGTGGFNHHDEEEEMRDLEEILSKLNPMAEEFVPPSLSKNSYYRAVLHSPPPLAGGQFGYAAVNNINGVSTGRVYFIKIRVSFSCLCLLIISVDYFCNYVMENTVNY